MIVAQFGLANSLCLESVNMLPFYPGQYFLFSLFYFNAGETVLKT